MKRGFALRMSTDRLIRRLAALHPDVTISLAIDVDHAEPVLYVDMIAVNDGRLRRCGLGTEAMEEVLKWADREGIMVALEPVSGEEGAVSWEEGVPRGRLVDWYRRLGFVENLPPNKLHHVEVSMYRLPRFLTKTVTCETLSA